jgi:4-amino-4-deoxy-L-arabinose transferase-like glycosyltransferase
MESVRPRPPRGDWSDRLLVLAALLFGAATVFYPFGGDQGLYFYVGREWLHGAVPYRDAMEQKTPLVFLLHALLIFLTGPNMWAIRLAELLWTAWLGVVIADLATPAGQPRRPGVLGVACLSTSALYFGLFNYWDTAQCEIWYAGLSLLSLRAATRGPMARRTWLLAGLFGGLAWLMKPPATLLLAIVLAAAALRAHRTAAPSENGLRRALAALSLYAAGGAAPVAVVLIYFTAVGALGDLIDLALRANYHDMIHSSSVSGAAEILVKFREFSAKTDALAPAIVALCLLGLLVVVRRRAAATAGRYAVALALLLAGCAAVALQRKFYGYHWGVLAPLMALPLACAAHDLSGIGRRRLRARVSPALLPACVAAVLMLALARTAIAADYARTALLTARYLTGRIDREVFLSPFVVDDNTPYAEQEVVGRWIAAHSSPADRIAVRGFEQTVYAVADRRAATRFFWTRWLTEPRRVYKRREWLVEDRAALRRNPPRYAVVNARARRGPASRAYFTRFGYVERFRHGRLIVLERAPAAAAGNSRSGTAP